MNTPFLGAAYYPEDWDESDIPFDIAKMKEAGLKVARIGEFAWRKMEPEKGRFDFGWLHHVVDELGKNGIKTVMGTPTATPPIWLLKEHPEAAVLDADNIRTSHGGRRHCCSNVPAYLEASDKIVEAMAKEFGDDENIIGWQIDNEIYQWGDGCCCEYCKNGFHRYLEKKYGTVEELDRRWDLNLFSQAYDSFDDIPAAVNAWHNPHIKYEWLVFHQESHIAFVHRQTDILRKYVKAPIGTDMMPVNGLDYEKTTEKLDIVMFNHYNDVDNLGDTLFWFDYLRTLKKAPFWNTETATSWNGSTDIGQVMKPEGFCRVNSWLPVALGGEGNMYWLWRQHWAGHELLHGAVLYPSGKPFHIFGEVQRTAEEFEKASDFITNTTVKTEIALHFTSMNWNLFETQHVVNGFGYAERLKNDFHAPLTRAGLRPDVIGTKKDLAGYKVLFSPLMMSLEDGDLPERIEQWVKNGGVWVAGPMTDIRNSIGAHYRNADTGMLERLTGCELTYSIPDSSVYVNSVWSDGEEFKGERWHELYTLSGEAESLVTVNGGHSSVIGKSVVFRVKVGKGEVIVLGTLPSAKDMEKLIGITLADAGIDLPEISGGVAAVPRQGKDTKGLILAEYKNKGGAYTLAKPMKDILTEKTYEGKTELKPYEMLLLEEI